MVFNKGGNNEMDNIIDNAEGFSTQFARDIANLRKRNRTDIAYSVIQTIEAAEQVAYITGFVDNPSKEHAETWLKELETRVARLTEQVRARL